MTEKNFVRGERAVLAEGTYQGTRGVFLQLRSDVHWVDIQRRAALSDHIPSGCDTQRVQPSHS